MGLWPFAFVAVLISWKLGVDSLNAVWMERWTLLLSMAALALAARTGKKYGWGLAPIVFTTLFSGVVCLFWFGNNHMQNVVRHTLLIPFDQELPEHFQVASVIRQACGNAMAAFLVLMALFEMIGLTTTLSFVRALALGGLATAVSIFFSWQGSQGVQQVALFDNPSMAASYVACSLFFVKEGLIPKYFWHERISKSIYAFMWAVGIAAILYTKATTPLAVLLSGLGVLFLYRSHWLERIVIGTAGALAVGTALYLTPWRILLQDNARFYLWKYALDWYERQEPFIHWFGLGPGTFRPILPLLQVEGGENNTWFLWLHNDWLQQLPEQGRVGVVAAGLAYGTLLWYARNSPFISAGLVSYGAMMATNFPIHWPVHAFMGFVLVKLAVLERELDSKFLKSIGAR